MATITRVSAGSNASIDDLNQLIDLLEGTAGYSLDFLLRALAGTDFKIRLADAAGARKLLIQDSAGVTVASIDSDGLLTATGLSVSGAFTLPVSSSPSQTAEGLIVWDSDDDRLTVGDGSSRKTFYPGAPTVTLAGSSLAEVATTATSVTDLITISGLNIPVTSGIRITGQFSRTGSTSANVGAVGLKVNATTIATPSTTTGIGFTTAVDRAEDGVFDLYIAPRSTDYLGGWIGTFACNVSSTGQVAVATQFVASGTTNPIPNAAVTSITITGINNTANVNIAVCNIKVYEVL